MSAEPGPDQQSLVVSGQTFVINKKYRMIKSIGHGAFGVVIAAENLETGQKVAIKKVLNAFQDTLDAKRVLREVKLMKHFAHENVVALLDIEPPPPTGFKDCYLVSELMETDLHRVIYSRQKLSPEHTQYFLYQILRALKYMHSANVLHRDLKPSNILLNSNCDLKICDFGLARGVDESGEILTEYVVTRWYRAPEIMLACKKYSKAVDVWAVGCIFGEMLRRKAMFPGADYMEQLKLIVECMGTPAEEELTFITSERALAFIRKQRGNPETSFERLFGRCDAMAQDLLRKLLVLNPADRITIDEALEHPYLASLHCPDDEPVAEALFDFEWERGPLDDGKLQQLMYEEMADFHPELKSGSRAFGVSTSAGSASVDGEADVPMDGRK